MDSENRVEELLHRYVEAKELRGVSLDAGELCKEVPDLLDPLRERIRIYEEVSQWLSPAPGVTVGTTLLHYQVIEKLGEGGMGCVYLALDTKLGRKVALKVLPPETAACADRLERFRREARLLAAMNHPHIAQVHALEEHQGLHFLVLELVQGETLAERIAKGPIPFEETLRLFQQIAEALEAAHDNHILHRDLKPANIKLTPEGKVKVLDFGLGKMMVDSADASLSGTSEKGVILGTARYMSPEQARGRTVDRRADIWAFGVSLYEALSGKSAFAGDTVSDTLVNVLEKEPDWNALPAGTPASLRRLLGRCLRKNEVDRLHDVADARIEIQEILDGADDVVVPLPETRQRRGSFWWLAVLAAIVAGVIGWTLRPMPRPGHGGVMRFSMGLAPATSLGSAALPFVGGESMIAAMRLSRTAVALSSNGTQLVYAGQDKEGSRLYLRPMDELAARPIPGTEDALGPFLSPDHAWVGFWAGGELKKVKIAGGPAETICETRRPYGASWSSENVIVFAQESGGLLQVSADGGSPRPLTVLDSSRHERQHLLPQVLGDAVLFVIRRGEQGWRRAEIAVQTLRTDERKLLIENGADARYLPTGHLVFVREGTLMATTFDPETLEIGSGPVALIEGVNQAGTTNSMVDTGAAQFTVSDSGTLVYAPGGRYPSGEFSLVWVDRNGAAVPLQTPRRYYDRPRLSPDGERVAVAAREENLDVWIYDLTRGNARRLSVNEDADDSPVWNPDGTRVAFASARSGRYEIYWKREDDTGSGERLVATPFSFPASWSRNGEALAFIHDNPVAGQYDIWVLPLGGEPRPLIQSPFDEAHPVFSPDGRWLAYSSTESGRREVYVQPYPGPGGKTLVSSGGGRSPVWSPTTQELFYRSLRDEEDAGWMMVVDFTTEPAFRSAKPRALFRDDFSRSSPLRDYDIAPDGKRFLMLRKETPPPGDVTELRVVVNWHEELKRLVPHD